ncbi:MAG: hypothetical protein UH239_08905 [Acutalibacteraceae bacterium]|nr:hypothetical protein [Acutalibacteraceae bacterium]
MAEILSIISLVSFIVSGVCFVLAIFFWIKFGIPTVIGDLSGRTARKSIAKMRESNERTGNKIYKPSNVNANRGKITDTITNPVKTETIKKKTETVDRNHPETGLLNTNKAELVLDIEATGLLNEDEETALLNNLQVNEPRKFGGVKLNLLDDVMLIHTDEVI